MTIITEDSMLLKLLLLGPGTASPGFFPKVIIDYISYLDLLTESSNMYTSESGNTRFNQDTQVGTTPDQLYNTNLIGRGKTQPKKLVRIKRDRLNNFVVKEISMSG